MAGALHLEVVTQSRRVVEADVDEVQLPAALGMIGVLPGHTPLLTTLGTGELAYRTDHRESYLAIQWGFAEVLPDRVTVLATVAEEPGEIDVEAAERERAEAEAALANVGPVELDKMRAKLELAVTRLQVARHRQR
ncbi:MAG TPA: F0F1 ATP synthase subunit epsilon [Acidobacteria bacterium]|nr:F0F1 ATP synthase subunit epsilon [Acidobacteriota bacterium]